MEGKIKAFTNGLLLSAQKIPVDEIYIIPVQTFTQPVFDMPVTH